MIWLMWYSEYCHFGQQNNLIVFENNNYFGDQNDNFMGPKQYFIFWWPKRQFWWPKQKPFGDQNDQNSITTILWWPKRQFWWQKLGHHNDNFGDENCILVIKTIIIILVNKRQFWWPKQKTKMTKTVYWSPNLNNNTLVT